MYPLYKLHTLNQLATLNVAWFPPQKSNRQRWLSQWLHHRERYQIKSVWLSQYYVMFMKKYLILLPHGQTLQYAILAWYTTIRLSLLNSLVIDFLCYVNGIITWDACVQSWHECILDLELPCLMRLFFNSLTCYIRGYWCINHLILLMGGYLGFNSILSSW